MRLFMAGVCAIPVLICFGLGFCEEPVGGGSGTECVILLHGLGRTKRSMAKISERLENLGYVTVNYGYPSTEKTIEALAQSNVSEAVNCCKKRSATKIHFVAHSLGAILIRQYLQENTVPELGRIVMLSPPNKGSEVTDKLKDTPLYKWITGPAGQELGTDEKSVPNKLNPIHVDVGIIAGNKSIDPWFSLIIPGDDDGKVSIDRTKLEEMSAFLVVECSHAFIMQDPKVIDQIVFFLQKGRFRQSQSSVSE